MAPWISGTFGLLGVLVGGAITAWVQHLRLKDERRQRAEQRERDDREREAVAAGAVIAALHPWTVCSGILLGTLFTKPREVPSAREQYSQSALAFINHLAAAKVITRTPTIADCLDKIADLYNASAALVDDATDNSSGPQPDVSEFLNRRSELRAQLNRVVKELELAASRR
jgi:hypothetical protein